MAALETRHGHVERALPLLQSSVSLESNPETLLRLAQLEAQQGNLVDAKKHVEQAISEAQQAGDLLTESRAEEELFRTHRSEGKKTEAEAALARSLSRVLVLQKMEASGADPARVERQLAHLLVYYDEKRAVRSAYARALEASRSNVMELEVTLTDMARSALTLGEVRLGREATQSALDLGLPAENSVYIALWQQLLEKRTDSSKEGTSREVLSRASKARGWLDTLRRFGLGEVKSSELSAQAHGIPEKAEARFYQALSGASSQKTLEEVAKSPAIDLIEVSIAQDLVAGPSGYKLPADVDLP